MTQRALTVCLCICTGLLLGLTSLSHADSAEVLPKGVFRGNVEYSYYFPIDERFDPDGDEEDIAADFNANLNSTVFPDLALLEAAFGMPAGSATIGTSVVSFEYEFHDLIFSFQYGVTDKLSVGIEIPYYFNKNNVDAILDTGNATVGSNPLFGTPGDPFGVPLIPISLGGVPLTTLQTQLLIGPGLDVNGDGTIDIQGFGYKPVKSWSESGFSDIEAGARYQYLKTENWRLAFTGGVRFPTGEVDDPDNLVDVGFGTGAWALLFHFNQDYIGIKNLILNATIKYDLYLPDKQRLRVPDDVNEPITPNKEKVDRNLGDVFVLAVSGAYEFLEGFKLSLDYEFQYKMKDDVSGDMGFNYDSLEDETRTTYHLGTLGLSYSTIPLFRKEKFPLPLIASIEYENLFAGKNILKQQLISFTLSAFF